ncbi:MAG: acyltransferase [Polaromonas sp.]|nr:MAG: acyltransferase [Polaromonas sp.]
MPGPQAGNARLRNLRCAKALDVIIKKTQSDTALHKKNHRSMRPTPSQGTVLPIQYLRGIAAMMVVFHHIKVQIPSFEGYLPGEFGASGVDVFFVISGFIMHITTANASIKPGEFMLRRMIRVAPLYWLLTALMCLVWWAAPSLFKTLIVTPATFFQSLFFIPHDSLAFPDKIFPLLVPGWTLNFEMFFYVIFALTLVLPKTLQPGAVGVFLVALVLLGVLAGPFDSALLATYTSPLLLEFAAGVLLGRLWLAQPEGLSTRVGVAVFLLGWALLVCNSVVAVSKYVDIVGASLIVAGALNTGFLRWKNHSLKVLGDATYAIYLSHIFTLGVFRVIWARLVGTAGSSLNALAFAATAMAVCLAAGVLLYICLEKPLTRYLQQRLVG